MFTIAQLNFSGVVDSAKIVDSAKAYVQNYFTTAGNTVADPMLGNVPADRNNIAFNTNLNPTPAAGGPAFTGLCDYPSGDPFFDNVWYKGAFSGLDGDFWLKGWTYMDETGFFSASVGIDKEELSRAITLYPNPSNGQIRVEMTGVQPAPLSLEVVDMVAT